MKTISTAILILALSGCGPKPASDRTDAGPDVNAMWTEFAASLNAGDAERWLALWTDDGVQLPPDEPAFVGKKRIRDKMRAALDGYWKIHRDIFNSNVAPGK
jgi:uncharacterized protein (TIGR02246 family)